MKATVITIRTEAPEDPASVRRVNELAFGRRNEGDLVDSLRANARPYVSLVAVVGGQVVGHIFFSPVSVESEGVAFAALGLAPMAVLPECQNQGIGTRLVREGLKKCQDIGHDIVVVLGHPQFYPRFGFRPASQKGLQSEYDVPDDVFMVAELKPGALDGRSGLVKYHREFGKV
jgi:putative acetyltransferase